MIFKAIRHSFPEPNGLLIDRTRGLPDYTFLHFYQSVELYYRGEIIKTKPGAVILYDLHTPQYFSIRTPLVHDWMHFSGSIDGLLAANGLQFDTVYYPKSTDFITQIMHELENEFYSSNKSRDKLLDIKFTELMIKLGRAVSGYSEIDLDRAVKERFYKLRERVFSSLNENWCIERMASMVGFGPSRFFTVYKALFGISPVNDLIHARIEKAKNLLLDGGKGICEISDALGYENTTHFIRQFKSKTGLSPTAYRRTVR